LVNSSTFSCYYYDGWRVLRETDGADALQRSYVYGNYLDEVLMMRDVPDGHDYYYAHDHLGSPAALLDNTGAVLERYEYDAYGKCYVMDDSYTAMSPNVSARNNVKEETSSIVDQKTK
jgi:hypothetical protein